MHERGITFLVAVVIQAVGYFVIAQACGWLASLGVAVVVWGYGVQQSLKDIKEQPHD